MNDLSFIFSWDSLGIEAIIDITKYQKWDQENLIKMLKEQNTSKNPLDAIIFNLLLRARYNSHRSYNIYAINCENTMDKEFWENQWSTYPEETANLIKDRGYSLYPEQN